MITCEDISGDCCQSCHEDWDNGYSIDKIYIYPNNDWSLKPIAVVCCYKSKIVLNPQPKEAL